MDMDFDWMILPSLIDRIMIPFWRDGDQPNERDESEALDGNPCLPFLNRLRTAIECGE
jgi:hypothetical protein